MARSEEEHEERDAGYSHVIKDFHHPYTPYAIQETFMGMVYDVLEAGSVGILESPTGTGKSLSLICGSLTWLRDFKGRAFEEGLNWSQDDSDEPAWVVEQAKARKRREMLRQREDVEARLARIRAKEKAQRDKYLKGDQGVKRRKVDIDRGDEEGEEQFVLEDYESDQEQNGSKERKLGGVFSAATLELMAKIGMGPVAPKEEEDEVEDEIKIFYCSRTHSQLTQFINELRRVNFPPAIKDTDTKDTDIEDLKHLTLGSRKNLCINPKVNKLNSLTAINERCAELQQSSTAKEHKCEFLPNKENQALVNTFRDHALATIRDIEDMGSLGKEIGVCPYYASRSAIRPAEIVTLPYPLLLQKSAREALGISLKGHVVIIDEAHNLMDAISGIHGVEVSLRQMKMARAQLGVYLQKFRNRLKGKNRVYIAQVVRVIDSLVGYLETRLSLPKADGIVSEKELLSGKGVDQINLFKLIRYLTESKLARKVEGYALHTTTKTAITKSPQQTEQTSTTPVLHHISSILSALTHPSKEGRLFYAKSPDTSTPDLITLKFLLLDPSTSFQEIVSQARSVILAGGTMSPMSDYTSHLFPYLPSTSITTLSCGHVIPKSNLVAWNLSKGPGGTVFEFTFGKRGDVGMVDELGRALLNICSVVPDGVVVFFPSYAYLSSILARWAVVPSSGEKSIIQRLEGKKALFQESKELGVDTILQEYAKAIDEGKGGLLLSVVGGKMSEGINFSDGLGRCVVIVGLPFPNAMSAEWKAKMEYIETSTVERLEAQNLALGQADQQNGGRGGVVKLSKEEIKRRAKDESRQFYENACMRAVNQSVGRAIRHQNDYAAIVMVDKRFGNERIKGKLPGWIRDGLVEGAGEKNFGALMGALSGFFRGKKKENGV
ncbi:related to ATP-dependent RNA helicase CHL1 [Phialocephala subalpina]|uniref:ATP-dependent DNA helicase CHL1 n=1 Tax=Phialocephala subalpina TaxID=576137 RepID=A0A1L7WXY4_9HELO|nr:related to ATP-dependent RNA helicase CHL1 [Phialocephala subalpina]